MPLRSLLERQAINEGNTRVVGGLGYCDVILGGIYADSANVRALFCFIIFADMKWWRWREGPGRVS